ncbi:hypothetical protein HXX76_015069 [Chlamydomonas incerta]|uniref:BTB domain-containing protein n=1 Tax=Chlamydomonas incerta TaxID=51695 RepID=A0A835VS34_CHLIN|nr:hypothetical protein HXX76_015069 [Chlamydomonas incerta]|eukprot:KAG2423793.1 hypothetical protein HXX76_015069 [Chlamydomonas incerta]
MARVKHEALHSVRSFQMLLVSGLTPSEMRSRMITEFTALGVVCALLAGLGFSVMATPPAKLLDSTKASVAFCAVTLISIICNLACVGFSTLMISSVNLLTDEITAWYIGSHAAIITNINFQFFNAGFLLLLVALVLFAVYTYPPVVAYVCGGLAVAAAALVITVYFIVDYARFYKLQDIVQIILGQDVAANKKVADKAPPAAGAGGGGGGTAAAGGDGGKEEPHAGGKAAAAAAAAGGDRSGPARSSAGSKYTFLERGGGAYGWGAGGRPGHQQVPRSLPADLGALLDVQPDGTADLTIRVGERRFHVHRAILSARCDYFKQRLAGDAFEDARAAELELPDADPDAFALLLRWLYTGGADVPSEQARGVAELADRLLLPELCAAAQDVVAASVTAGSVVDCLLWAWGCCESRSPGGFGQLLGRLKEWYVSHHEEVRREAGPSRQRLMEAPVLNVELFDLLADQQDRQSRKRHQRR